MSALCGLAKNFSGAALFGTGVAVDPAKINITSKQPLALEAGYVYPGVVDSSQLDRRTAIWASVAAAVGAAGLCYALSNGCFNELGAYAQPALEFGLPTVLVASELLMFKLLKTNLEGDAPNKSWVFSVAQPFMRGMAFTLLAWNASSICPCAPLATLLTPQNIALATVATAASRGLLVTAVASAFGKRATI